MSNFYKIGVFHLICFSFLLNNFFIYISNYILFSCFFLGKPLSHPLFPCVYECVPPPTQFPPPHLDIPLPCLSQDKGPPPMNVQQGHPLLLMQLGPWVPPCVLFSWWFSPCEFWGVWLFHIFVLPMGLQTPSAPLALSLTPPLGTPCHVACFFTLFDTIWLKSLLSPNLSFWWHWRSGVLEKSWIAFQHT
jgi:hypothetical protein